MYVVGSGFDKNQVRIQRRGSLWPLEMESLSKPMDGSITAPTLEEIVSLRVLRPGDSLEGNSASD